MSSSDLEREATALGVRVANISIAVNLLLMAFKLVVGLLAHSAAMVSDAVHTASDVVATVIVLLCIKVAHRGADGDHPYGHERFESLGSFLVATILFFTGLGLGWAGLESLFSASAPQPVGRAALYAAIVSIITKEALYWYTHWAAQKIGSNSLEADAWHHRSDALSSIGALMGIGASLAGYPWGDPIAALVICLLILKTAWEIGYDSAQKLLDKACDPELSQAMRDLATSQAGVLSVRRLRTRLFDNRIYVDLNIVCQRDLPLYQAHAVAHTVQEKLEEAYPQIKGCLVHVDPSAE